MSSYSSQIIKYEKILAEQPKSHVFAPLSEAYCKMGLFDKAMDILKKGIRYNPNYVLGYTALARCYYSQKEYQLAYSTLRPIVSAHRDNLKLQLLFAETAKVTNNFEESLDTYRYLNFLKPSDKKIKENIDELQSLLKSKSPDLKHHEISFNLEGLESDELEAYDLDDWEQVSLLNNDDDPEILEQEVNEEEWQANEELSIEEPPEEEQTSDALFTHTLVDLYLSQGHRERAIEILNKILEIKPDDLLTKNKLSELTESESINPVVSPVEEPDQGYKMLEQSLDNLETMHSSKDLPQLRPLNDFAKLLQERKKDILSEK